MLFVDFSSAFNIIIPHKLVQKLSDLGLHSSLFSWILDFLSNRPQSVKIGGHTSSTLTLTLTLNSHPEYRSTTGVCPQPPPLLPLYTSLFPHSPLQYHRQICRRHHHIVGLITNNNETAYREEVRHLAEWCSHNNLDLKTTKTKGMIIDFRRSK